MIIMNSCLASRILNTLYKDVALPMQTIKQQFKAKDIEEECVPLIKNGMISLKNDEGYMTPKQKHNFTFISEYYEGR